MKNLSPKTIVMTGVSAAMLCAGASVFQFLSTAGAAPTTQARVAPDPIIDAYVAEVRADLSDGKVLIISKVMNLSNEEAKVFWPIYEDYESELFELGDQRVDLIRRFAAAQKDGKLEQRDASALADGYFKFEQQRLDLMKKYHGIIAGELSQVRAAQFTQIEHRIGTVVDLTIAASMPLIEAVPGAPSR